MREGRSKKKKWNGMGAANLMWQVLEKSKNFLSASAFILDIINNYTDTHMFWQN